MKMDGNVMRMRELEKGLEIPPGATVSPGARRLSPDDDGPEGAAASRARKVPLTLVFEKAGKIDVELAVEAMGAHAAPITNSRRWLQRLAAAAPAIMTMPITDTNQASVRSQGMPIR